MAMKKNKKKVDSNGKHVWTQRCDTRVVTDALARAAQDSEMMATGGQLTSVVNVLLLKYGQGRKV
jgi:HD-like signal output (HDOD) protein